LLGLFLLALKLCGSLRLLAPRSPRLVFFNAEGTEEKTRGVHRELQEWFLPK